MKTIETVLCKNIGIAYKINGSSNCGSVKQKRNKPTGQLDEGDQP